MNQSRLVLDEYRLLEVLGKLVVTHLFLFMKIGKIAVLAIQDARDFTSVPGRMACEDITTVNLRINTEIRLPFGRKRERECSLAARSAAYLSISCQRAGKLRRIQFGTYLAF